MLKSEMRIRPNLQFSVLCDDVRREDNGKLILLGLFEVIGAAAYPAVHSKLFVVNRWCKGAGEFSQKIRLTHSKDNVMLLETKPQDFTLEDIESSHTLISEFDNVKFPAAGKYWVEVFLDGELVLNYPIKLVEHAKR
jgi:hypothetical protein